MVWNDIVFPIKEVWKKTVGSYEVSNYGRVRSLDRVITYIRNGSVVSRKFKGRLMKPKTDKDGYLEVCLSLEDRRLYRRVHRLVAEAFVEGYEDDYVVDHIVPEKDYNMFYNLQWCTSTYNVIKHYSEEANLIKPLSSLSKYEWYYIGYLYNQGLEYQAIAENIGLGVKSVDTIWEGLSGRRLSSITGFKKGDFIKRKHPVTKLDTDVVCTIIKERLLDGLSLKTLSYKYGIAESMISRFCSGKRQPEGLQKFKKRYK